jgi:predicted nucleic acid-binding protein
VESIIEERIVPFEKPASVLAARLFNQTGRRRSSRFDCLIAAAAITAGADLATINTSDFTPFIAHGLKLK